MRLETFKIFNEIDFSKITFSKGMHFEEYYLKVSNRPDKHKRRYGCLKLFVFILHKNISWLIQGFTFLMRSLIIINEKRAFFKVNLFLINIFQKPTIMYTSYCHILMTFSISVFR